MNKKLITGAALALLLAGCGSENSDDAEGAEQQAPVTSDSSEEENIGEPVETPAEQEDTSQSAEQPEENSSVIAEVKQQLTTEVPVKLPENIETLMEDHVTAATQSDSGSYMVEFYETETAVPVNDPAIEGYSDAFAVFTGTRFESAEEAEAQINYREYASDGLTNIDLGYGITGVHEGAAGSQYISWNEGRWALSIRGTTQQGDSLIEDAKTVVQFLEDHLLPAPQRVGAAQFDATDDGEWHQFVTWQEDDIVYEITTTETYEKALEFAIEE